MLSYLHKALGHCFVLVFQENATAVYKLGFIFNVQF
jgi:hypothetical protein